MKKLRFIIFKDYHPSFDYFNFFLKKKHLVKFLQNCYSFCNKKKAEKREYLNIRPSFLREKNQKMEELYFSI